jgi:sigma-B regulation protein RsbU (phosphoserine phosphatase)
MLKNRSLAAHLIIFILTSTTIIFVAVMAYNYYASKMAVMEEVAENARNLTMSTAYKIEVILRGVEKVPRNLAGIIEEYPYTREDLFRLIKNAIASNSEVFGVAIAFEPYAFDLGSYYFSPYGYRENDRIDLTFLGGDAYQYFHWDWYQIPKELNRPVWTEPYYDEGGGNIIMSTFSVPFYKEMNGKRAFRGIVTSDISLMWLKDIVSAVKIYQTGYAFLISQNGEFFTHPEKKLIMKESIFSVAEAGNDLRLRRIGQEMIRGGEGFVPLQDFVSGEKSWMYYAPLPSTDWALGVVISEEELFAPIRLLSTKVLAIGIIGLIFLGVIITWLSKTVTKPLRILDTSTSAIAKGDFSVSVEETGPREIAGLGHSFNQLGQQLTEYMEKRDFIRDTFGRYVTQEVVNKLLESQNGLELGGENREVSIIMSDLRGFTALTADMESGQVITFLNRYLSKMIEILLDHRAIIDEIIGDGILAFFGAPEPMDDHAVRAVACALQMQQAMEEINALNETDELPHLEMGIAVNTGTVVVGNIGSERRTKYGLVGAQVNFTGRIESFTVGGQILIGESTYQRVGSLVDVRDTMEVEMKGIPGVLTLYDVRGISGPYNIRLKERHETLIPLTDRIHIHLYRVYEKVVTGTAGSAWIKELCETVAVITHEGELAEWENVRIHLLDERMEEMPGRVYGKVISIKPLKGDLHEAEIRFTSVSPEILHTIRKVVRHSGEGE